MQLTGSTVVVTGASSGIGLATARAFAARGARPVLAARAAERLDRAAVDRFGRIDVWVNYAGTSL